MQKLMITKINFKHDDGIEEDYTSVELSFQSVGTTFLLEGPVIVNRNEYEHALGEGMPGLIHLALTKVVQGFGKDLV